VALVLVLLPACAVGPDYTRPDTPAPDAWHQQATRGLADGKADLRTWWTVLNDPVLNGLIERATAGNLDLQEALARILEARAFYGIARGERFPDIDGAGTEQRTRTSEEVLAATAPPGKRTDTFYQDRDVLVSLYAEVAATYLDVRSLQARIRFAVGNAETQRGSLKLTEDRRDAGIGSELEVSQAALNLAATQSFIPSLRAALARSIHRLGVLLGESPSSLYAELLPDGPIPAPPEEILVGLPTELLRQRPDIRRAERELAAQTAEIGVATAALYPTFSLVGTFALESFRASEWLERKSLAHGFGPAFRWNLFDGGRVRNAIRVEDARTEQAIARYEQSVLDALEEVENAMVSYVQESDRRDALARAVAAARKSVELVNTLYRTGLTDFQNVLDMERSLFEQEDALAESEGLVTQALIRIYKALGGGWAPATTAP
jgi:NodT family efflux transporter outer membrane factor (OMF) lipoprotein